MTCEEFDALVEGKRNYLELSATELTTMHLHMSECDRCYGMCVKEYDDLANSDPNLARQAISNANARAGEVVRQLRTDAEI